MKYVVSGLEPESFAQLSGLGDDALHAVSARRVIADAKPGYPCRVSLEGAEVGEALILLPFAHHVAEGPYSASGPIFVRERAVDRGRIVDKLPEQLRIRLLSIRAYDAHGDMVDATVVEGTAADPVVRQFLERAEVELLHVHFARHGCYAARIDRVA